MKPELILKRKAIGLLQSGALLGGMGLLLAIPGWILAGFSGVLVALLSGTLILFLGPSFPVRIILRAQGAREVHPAQAPDLYEVLLELSRRAGLERAPRLFYISSPIPNAFTLGGRAEPAITITEGLIQKLNRRELCGVLAHEIGHIQNNDLGILALARITRHLTRILSFFGLFLIFLYLPLILAGAASLNWFAPLILLGAPTMSAILELALSRTREFAADVEAARLTGDPAGLASALEKMERSERGFWPRVLLPSPEVLVPRLLRTHPATRERIRKLLELRSENVPRRHLKPERRPAVVVGPRGNHFWIGARLI